MLVTDAAGPAGAKPGRYRLGEQDVDLTADGRVLLVGQEKLAGSALRMDRGVDNLRQRRPRALLLFFGKFDRAGIEVVPIVMVDLGFQLREPKAMLGQPGGRIVMTGQKSQQ